jgi:hypothetical protein
LPCNQPKNKMTNSQKNALRIGYAFVAAFAGFAVWYIATAISMVVPYIATHSH